MSLAEPRRSMPAHASRRSVLAGALALAACGRGARAQGEDALAAFAGAHAPAVPALPRRPTPALRALVRARDPKGVWTSATILSAGGQSIPAEVADLPRLRVGGLLLQHLSVAFADLHTFHMWNLADRPAILLGVDVLSQFDSVALDFARGEVRFRLPANA